MANDSDHTEAAPEPMGAKQTDPDPRLVWREERARLGGYDPPVEFDELQQQVINAAADTMIPPGGEFPAPSDVEIVDFVGRYVTPADKPVKFFPLAGEDDFKKQLGTLGQEFVDASPDERVKTLSALEEQEDPEEGGFFSQLRALFYHGYYARPEVVAVIRSSLEAGADYHGPPQPYGYGGLVEPWPDGSYDHGRGGYVATEDVVRVDIPEDLKAEYGVSA